MERRIVLGPGSFRWNDGNVSGSFSDSRNRIGFFDKFRQESIHIVECFYFMRKAMPIEGFWRITHTFLKAA